MPRPTLSLAARIVWLSVGLTLLFGTTQFLMFDGELSVERIAWLVVLQPIAVALVAAFAAHGLLRDLRKLANSTRDAVEPQPSSSVDPALAAIALNLKARHDLERTLRREVRTERDRLDRVLSSMHEGVMLLGKDGRVQLINEALGEMLMLGPETVGQSADVVVPGTELGELLKQALAGVNSSRELELPGSPPKTLLANVRRLRKRRGALAVLVDITAVRQLQKIRQEFVANASHELRTPVAAILSAAETLQDAGGDDSPAFRRFVEMILRNAERLRLLLNDLLEVSQLESGRHKAELQPVELRATALAISGSHRAAAEKKHITMTVELSKTTWVRADERGLEHVLGNLVQNAINYCPPDSLITLTEQNTGSFVKLSVKDNGPGIAAEHRSRIFERFYRVDTGRSREVGGTGLGLSIVKHWVEAMCGSIELVSTPGQGTTFIVTLPASQPPEPRRTRPSLKED